jgi:DNA-binding NarL/FixJ family response regulator
MTKVSEGMQPIRVVLVDDQELFRAGIQVILDAQPDIEVVGTAADGNWSPTSS